MNGYKVTGKKDEIEINNNKCPEACYVDPLSIKSVRTSKFENTFLATKEFEERLKVVHGLSNGQEVLTMYVNNLDKNLWEVDAKVAQLLNGKNKTIFEKFAAMKLTTVEGNSENARELAKVYQTKNSLRKGARINFNAPIQNG